MNYTVDASVFVAAVRAAEPHNAVSKQFLKHLRRCHVDIFCPSLVLPESSAAIARRTGRIALAARTVSIITNFPNLQFIPLTLSLAQRAAQIASDCRVRGADAVYIATAEGSSATLITWDGEVLTRGASIIAVITPADWLASQQATT